MISSAMVGRDDGAQAARKAVHATDQRPGSVVNITGIAGIGKSRLMAEMREKELMSKVILLEGQGCCQTERTSASIPSSRSSNPGRGSKRKILADDALNKLQRAFIGCYPEAFDEIFPFHRHDDGLPPGRKSKRTCQRDRRRSAGKPHPEEPARPPFQGGIDPAGRDRDRGCPLVRHLFGDLPRIALQAGQETTDPVCRRFQAGHAETGERIRKFAD
ncbi:MAG: hypothetical protein MZU84_02140 [Sphingobacterium sp.]|nr:hypothetical protein [Sphingobacterium sp.]